MSNFAAQGSTETN